MNGEKKMKTISKESYEEIRSFVYRNSRPIELSLWKYFFENGNKEDVVEALTFYQNEDGGFGNALEADSLNPNSSPYTTLYAINILKHIDFVNFEHKIYKGILRYLESTKDSNEEGWFFTISSNDNYAHAPWMTYSSEENKIQSIGLSLEIASFILKNCNAESDLYKRALSIRKKFLNKLNTEKNLGEMGIGGYCVLLETIKETTLKECFDYDTLLMKIKKLVNDSIETDMSKWQYYVVTPSRYIISPDSIFYKDNEDIMQKELDYLIEIRPQNNVWNITWSWFDNNEKYPKEFAISENWWKSYKAIEKMTLLRNFKRIEI